MDRYSNGRKCKCASAKLGCVEIWKSEGSTLGLARANAVKRVRVGFATRRAQRTSDWKTKAEGVAMILYLHREHKYAITSTTFHRYMNLYTTPLSCFVARCQVQHRR
jgi:hypothetical protein